MRKFIILVVLTVAGVKYGLVYLDSREFYDYAEREKPTWACPMYNLVGNLYCLRNQYELALFSFSTALHRCPGGDAADTAEFKIAETLDNMSQRHIAGVAYDSYALHHAGSHRARIAEQAADFMRN